MPSKANPERDAQASKAKILAAAEMVFAEKGYDGARVDEIAKRAGVNKALLYYYFESKERILRALTEKHFNQVLEERQRFIDSLLLESQTIEEAEIADRIFKHVRDHLVHRKPFLRIMASEALKSGSFTMDFFRILDAALPRITSILQQLGREPGQEILTDPIQTLKRKTFFFFNCIAPVMFYHMIGDKWAEYSGVEGETIHRIIFDEFQNAQLKSLKTMFATPHPEEA